MDLLVVELAGPGLVEFSVFVRFFFFSFAFGIVCGMSSGGHDRIAYSSFLRLGALCLLPPFLVVSLPFATFFEGLHVFFLSLVSLFLYFLPSVYYSPF